MNGKPQVQRQAIACLRQGGMCPLGQGPRPRVATTYTHAVPKYSEPDAVRKRSVGLVLNDCCRFQSSGGKVSSQ